jgi:hypothetical protein
MRHANVLALAVCLLATRTASANDPWEFALYNSSDDDITTLNYLQHGDVQRGHDLEGSGTPPDADFYALNLHSRHSYEIRVGGGIEYWGLACSSGPCPRLDLLDSAGNLLIAASLPYPDDIPITVNRGPTGPQPAFRTQTLRFASNVTVPALARVLGDQAVPVGPGHSYEISFRDTTYFAPRWNNSGTQVSVVVVQNLTPNLVFGSVDFFDASGNLLYDDLLWLEPHGSNVISTAGTSQLVGQSGSLSISHDGGYGALAGKVVALEPATGFTFDTLLAPMPY